MDAYIEGNVCATPRILSNFLPNAPGEIGSGGERNPAQNFSKARRAKRVELFFSGGGRIGVVEGVLDDHEAVRGPHPGHHFR